MASLIEGMDSGLSDWVEGYQTRIADGTWMAGTDHRLEVLQSTVASALPGKSLVVFDPKLKLVRDVFLCEDRHGQERTLFGQWLETVEPRQLWIADRNMSTLGVMFGITQRQAALGWVHGVGKVEAGISLYYLVDEMQATYRGMMIAIEPAAWSCFATSSFEQLLETLH